MKILVINAGSSSLKYQLFDMDTEKAIAKGTCERIAIANSFLTHKVNGKEYIISQEMPTHVDALKLVLKALLNEEYGVIKDVKEIGAVGHRVLHSGEDFTDSVLIDEEVIRICKKNTPLGPLHMPANVGCILSCREVMPNVPEVAVFDTSFHLTMPKYAYLYAIPYQAYRDWKVRKYGFHGTSHRYVSGEAINYLGKSDLKIITCHLGNGASVAAVNNGKCVDTSMGITPLEGLIMGTRSGDIDPAVLEFLMDKTGMTIKEMLNYLNKKSGLLGISELSSDSRDLEKAASEGNEKAQLALEMFAYRVRKYIGSYAAAMGGVDAVVFTGGIGENSSSARYRITKDLGFLGIKIDEKLNDNFPHGTIVDLSSKDATVKTLIIPTNEELVIARDTLRLVNKK
jgi:acetate kinase